MNFIEIIGKNFEEAGFSSEEYTLEYQNDEWRREEGMTPNWYVSAVDGSFEIRLNENKVIETIFLYPTDKKFRLEGYTADTPRNEIRKKMGLPTSQGNNIKPLFGKGLISFDRYDMEHVNLHFEYSDNDSKIRMITLMLPQKK